MIFSKVGLSGRFIPVQRYDFSNHLSWLKDGRPGGMGKYSHVFSRQLDEEYKKCLEKAWLCDSVLAVVGKGQRCNGANK